MGAAGKEVIYMSKKKNETIAMAVNNNAETVTDAGNEVGTNTIVGIDAASNLHKAQETDAETVMAAGTDNGSVARKGGVVDVAAIIGTATDEVSVGADAVSDGNNGLDNDSNNAHENGATIDVEDDQSTIGNEIDEGMVSDADECDLNVKAEPENDTDILDSTDTHCCADAGSGISKIPSKKKQGFPYEDFPKWVRDQIEDVCQAVQAPAPVASNLLLSLVAACIARNIYVSAGRHREPTNFWSITLAEASTGKSPVFAMMKEPLVNSEMINHMVSDITIPFFVQLLEEKHKLFMLDDELGFLIKLTQGNDFDHSSLVDSYNETTFSHGRCKSGLKIIRNPSLTIGMAGQQDVFIKRLLNCEIGQYLDDSGVLDRMEIVFVDDTERKVYMTDPPCNNEVIAATYREKMSWLISIGQRLEEEGLASIELELSPEANRRRCEVLNAWEDELEVNEEFKMIRKWIRKADGLSLRLAGIVYMIFLVAEGYPVNLANLPPISVEVMEISLRLLEYYRDQTIFWRLQVSSEVRSTFALRVFRSIRQLINSNHSGDCSMRDVKQSVRDEHGKLDEIAFNAAIKELVDNEWIAVEEPPKQKRRGRPASERIRIIRGQSQKAAA